MRGSDNHSERVGRRRDGGCSGEGREQLGDEDKAGGEGCPALGTGRWQTDRRMWGWTGMSRDLGEESAGLCMGRVSAWVACMDECMGRVRAWVGCA